MTTRLQSIAFQCVIYSALIVLALWNRIPKSDSEP
jgi:hypothetical protein